MWVALALPMSGCVSRTAGTQVDVVLHSTGLQDPVQDDQGREWTILEAWIEVSDVSLVACEAAPTARLTSPSGGVAPWRPVDDDVPIPPARPASGGTPRHGGASSGGTQPGRWIDLRRDGEVGAWTLSPPVTSWCGVALALQGPPSWGLHAIGPWEVVSGSAQYVFLEVPLDEPLQLTPDAPEGRVDLSFDPLRWLGALQSADGAAEALPEAVSTARITP